MSCILDLTQAETYKSNWKNIVAKVQIQLFKIYPFEWIFRKSEKFKKIKILNKTEVQNTKKESLICTLII